MEIYLCIPAIPLYGYTVCHGVPKSTTVPVPTLPVLENLWVFPYPCQTLLLTGFGVSSRIGIVTGMGKHVGLRSWVLWVQVR